MLGSVIDYGRGRGHATINRILNISKENKLSILFLALYAYLIVLPFVAVVLASFRSQGNQLVADWTIQNYVQLFQTNEIVIYNTVVFAIGTATLTTIMAIFIAWTIARTNTPYGRVFYGATFVGFFFPPVAWEVIWIRLAGANGLYPTLLGVESLFIETLPGMVFVASVRRISLAIILLVPLFASLDKTMEEAGQISGAGIVRVLKDITLPILMPGIAAVYLLCLLITLGDFRTPLIIGLPNGIRVLSVAVYESANLFPVDYGLAMAQAVFLVVLAVPCLYLYRKSIKRSERFETISERGYNKDPIDIGRWRYATLSVLLFFFVFIYLMPVFLMFYASFLPFYIHPHHLALRGGFLEVFTIHTYVEVLTHENVHIGLRNSFIVAFIVSTLLVGGSVFHSWLVNKTNAKFRQLLDQLSFSVIGLPSVTLAVGLMWVFLVYLPYGTVLYTSLFILIVAMYTRYIPATQKVIEPNVIQITSGLLEAGKMAGDSITQRIRYIVTPLVKEGATAAWAMRFAVVFMELPIAILLGTRHTTMVAPVLVRFREAGDFTHITAFGVVIVVVLGAITYLVHKIGHRL